jgi:hypothetical protein
MSLKRIRFFALASVFAVLAAGARGQAPDFGYYVSLGDSLTAGWESGCLVDRHQLRSYPATLARQMGHIVAQPGDQDLTHFQQPLVSEPGIPQPCYTAEFDPASHTIFIATHAGEAPGHPENADLPRPYNNLGIPGAHSYDLIDRTTSDGTDIYGLVLRNVLGTALGGINAIQEALAQNPTFVTLWIGNNDVLDAAGSGLVISDSCGAANGDPGGHCDGITLTPLAEFTAKYTEIVQTLHGGDPNATLMLVNVPDVTAIPFATTLPPVVVNPATGQPVLGPDGHPIPLIGEKHDGTVEPLPSGTLVTLAAASLEAQGVGIPCLVYMAQGGPANFCVGTMPDGNPNPNGQALPDGSLTQAGLSPGVLLYADEVAYLHQRTSDLNAAIATAAAGVGAKVMDVNALFNDIRARGRSYGGVHVSTAFLTGGLFSYDGVHPSNIGYAVVADEMVKFINTSYGTHLTRPNVWEVLFESDNPNRPLAPPNTRPGTQSIYPVELWQDVLRLFPPVDSSIHVIPPASLFSRLASISGR